jgi:hypothetical protein
MSLNLAPSPHGGVSMAPIAQSIREALEAAHSALQEVAAPAKRTRKAKAQAA